MLALVASADEIRFDTLPESFVIKSSASSSGKAALLVERSEPGRYIDLRTGTALSVADIRDRVAHWLDGPPAPRRSLLVEERVPDVWGGSVPHDYKAYAFQGHVELVLEINRNHRPPQVTWFNGDFEPLPPGSVDSRERYVTPVERERPPFCGRLAATGGASLARHSFTIRECGHVLVG